MSENADELQNFDERLCASLGRSAARQGRHDGRSGRPEQAHQQAS
jgi:hypothetical protein